MPSSFARLTGKKPAVDPRIIALPRLTGYENLRSPEEKGAFLRRFDEQIDVWRKSIIFPTDIDATVTTTVEEAMATHKGEEPLIFIPPLVRSGNAISIQAASATTDGYLTATDWNTFNNALTFPVVDTTILLKGSDSPDKQLRIEIDGFTAGVTRVLTPPDADITIAGVNIAQTFTANQTIDLAGVGPRLAIKTSGVAQWQVSSAGQVTQLGNLIMPAGDIQMTSGSIVMGSGGEVQLLSTGTGQFLGQVSAGSLVVGPLSISAAGLITFPDGVRQIFNPDATNSGLNVGAHTADPSALVNGDIFYQSTSNELRARINGATVTLSTSVSGAPSNATYITQTPDGTLSNEQALSLLATGILKNTTTTGVLSIAVQGTDYYAPGGTDVAVADGGTGASTAAGARTNLGLVIGTDVQAQNAILQDIAGLTQAIDKIIYFDSATTAGTADITAFARTLIDDADATAARVTLGVVIGTNVQAFDATLTAFAAYNTNGLLTQTAADTFTGRTITGTADKITVTNGDGVAGNPTLTIASTYVGQTSITTLGTITTGTWTGTTIAILNGGTGATTAAGARTNLGLVIGTDVEAPLTFSAPLSRAANTISIPQANGSTDGFLDSGDWTIFNSKQDALPVVDTTAIIKGSVTASKLLRFEVDGFTAATTRVLTPQNADYTIAGLETVQTFTVPQTFASNVIAQISIFNADGSATGPSYAFSSDDTSGLFYDSALPSVQIAVSGSGVLQVDPAGITTLDIVALGAATIGTLNGVIIGTAGVLSAVADLPFSSLAQGSALSVLGVTGNATADNASIAAASDHQVLRRSGTAVAFGAVDLSQSAAVTGSLLAVNGGTGFASYAVGDVLYADTTTTLAKLADIATGNALISGGVNTAPSWGKIGLTTHVSGTLGVANGGTGAGAFTAGSIVFAGGSGVYTEDNAGLFWNDASNRLGIGAVTTSSHGTCTVARTQSNSALAAADSHILVRNPSGSQSMLIFATGAGDTIRGGVRSDSSGNFNWHASGSQGHQFYGSNTVSDTNVVAGFSLSGVVVGGIAGSVSTARLDVTTRATTNIGQIIKALASHTANLLEIRSSANAVMASFGPRGDLSVIPGVATSGNPVSILLTGALHTNLTASAEVIDVNLNMARIVQRATGAVTTQRAMLVQAPTYSFVGASTITTASTLAITAAPVAGTNATITNAYALWVQAGISRFDGNLSLNDGVNIVLGASTGTQIGTSAGEKIGWWGTTPVVQSVDWNPTNVTTDKVFDANATTLDEIADALGSLILQLRTYGLLGA